MRSIAAAIVGAAVLAGPMLASQFTATVGTDPLVSTAPVCHSLAVDAFSSGNACAGASVGVQGVAAQPGGGFPQVFTEATTVITDLMITGPGTSVTGTVTIPFESIILDEWEAIGGGHSGASGRVNFGLLFGQYSGSAGYSFDESDGPFPPTVIGTGWTLNFVPTHSVTVLVGGSIHDDSYQFNGFVTFTQTFPVGVVIPVSFDVQGGCSAAGLNLNAFPSTCQFDALDPFGFVPGFSSFNLPDGYSVDAPSIGLVNGQLPSSAVPEPSAMDLLGSGFAMLLAGKFLQSRDRRHS